MFYMLDTDTSSYIIKKRPLSVLQALQNKVKASNIICISAITYAEQRLGAERSVNSEKHHALISEFVQRLEDVVPWDKEAADKFAQLQSYLFTNGRPIGNNDTMIAAHALATGAVLVTNNIKHFSRVPDLNIETGSTKPHSRLESTRSVGRMPAG